MSQKTKALAPYFHRLTHRHSKSRQASHPKRNNRATEKQNLHRVRRAKPPPTRLRRASFHSFILSFICCAVPLFHETAISFVQQVELGKHESADQGCIKFLSKMRTRTDGNAGTECSAQRSRNGNSFCVQQLKGNRKTTVKFDIQRSA